MKDVMPVDSWVLCMMATSKGSTKKNVNELVGEWEWKDFRIKKKYIYYDEKYIDYYLYHNYEEGKNWKEMKLGEKKDYLTPFSLYKGTKQSCKKLDCRQQIPPDWIISRMLKVRIVLLDYCQHQSHHREKSVLPCKSVMGSNLSHILVCLTLQVLTRLYVDWFLQFLDWRRVRKRTYFWLILSYPRYIHHTLFVLPKMLILLIPLSF